MGYPAEIERGPSRTDATRARDLALPEELRRQKAVGSSSRSTMIGRSFFSARRGVVRGCMALRGNGKKLGVAG